MPRAGGWDTCASAETEGGIENEKRGNDAAHGGGAQNDIRNTWDNEKPPSINAWRVLT